MFRYYGEVFERWSGKMEPKWNMNPDRYDGITKAQMKGLITRKRKVFYDRNHVDHKIAWGLGGFLSIHSSFVC